jgi:hypothetical protein
MCVRIAHQHSREHPGNASVVVVDGSDYFAAVLCTKDFGCVLHERKA